MVDHAHNKALANEATSKLVASIASKILKAKSKDDFTLEEAKAVAGSCLTQKE